jgi:competence protein ComEC
MARLCPRLAILALGLALGIALAAFAFAPGLAGAATVGLWVSRRPRAAAVALAACAGALLAAAEARERAAWRQAIAPAVGDRIEDLVAGRVSGPVERQADAIRFVLAASAAGDLALDPPVPVLVSLWHHGDEPAILPGDRIEVLGLLRWPRGYRVPGAPDPETWAATRGVVALIGSDAARVEWSAGPELEPWRLAGRVQRRLADRVSDVVGADGGALRALVTGDRGAMSEEETAWWRESGASHALAVSGLHLAVVALLAFSLVRRGWARVPALALRVEPARAGALIGALLAVAYTVVTGASPSAVRAMWVVLVFCLGVVLDRRARLADALGAAAILVLIARPAALHDPSVQLSFAATAALGVAVARRGRTGSIAGRVIAALRATLTTSIFTWLATAPISAWHFGQIALAGPVANLVAVPAVELFALPVGLCGVVLAEVWPAGGAALVALAALAIERVSSALANLAAWVPALAVATGPVELCAWCAAAAAPLSWLRGWRRGAAAVAAAALAIAASSWLWHGSIAPGRRTHLTAAFLDVGQGDAAVIELPGGGVWLIDAGGLAGTAHGSAPGREAVARYLAHRRISRLDLVILSHPHPDHFLGLIEVARAVAIDEVWLAAPPAAPELAHLLEGLRARGTRVTSPPLGTVWRQGGAALTVLAPVPLDPGPAAADPVMSENDGSLVVRVELAGRRLLFTGDVEEEGEAALIARGVDLAADLVKAPHHGSRTSSGPALVAATSPRWVVISCGVLNRFGFPHPEVVARWRAAGAAILRTDQVGTVTATIEADGRMRVEGLDPPPPAAE